MKVQFSQALTGILLSVALFSCNKKTSTASKAAPKKAMCSALPDGTVPSPTPLSGAGLKLEGTELFVEISKIKTTGVLGIHVDAASLGAKAGMTDGETPSFFLMYRICKQDDSTCLKSPKSWMESPFFDVNNVVGSPQGDLKVSAKICIDDLEFLAENDRKTFSTKSCDDSSPCYCGNEVNSQVKNTYDPASADPSLKSSSNIIHARLDQANKLARRYHRQGKAYVKVCEASSKETQDLQNARNISHFTGSDLASMAVSFDTRSFVKGVQAELANSSTKLALAETNATASCPAGAIDTSQSGGDISLPSDTSAIIDSVTEPGQSIDTPNTSTNSSVASSSSTKSSTSTDSSSATASTSTSSGSPVLKWGTIFLGSVAIVTGAALVGTYGLSKFTKYRTSDVLDVLGNTKLGKFARGSRTIASRIDAAKKAFDDMNTAFTKDPQDWDAFEKARTRYQHAVVGGESFGVGPAKRTSKGLRDVILARLDGTPLPPELDKGLTQMEQLHAELQKFEKGAMRADGGFDILQGDARFATSPGASPAKQSLGDLLSDNDFKIQDAEKRMRQAVADNDPAEYKKARDEHAKLMGVEDTRFPEITEKPDSRSGKQSFAGEFTVDGKIFIAGTFETPIARQEFGVFEKISSRTLEPRAISEWHATSAKAASFPESGNLKPVTPKRTGPNPKGPNPKGAIVGAIVIAAGIAAIVGASMNLAQQNAAAPALQCGKFAATENFWESHMAEALDALNSAKNSFNAQAAK